MPPRLPDPATDGYRCRLCQIHRTTGPQRLCPGCEDKAKREEQ